MHKALLALIIILHTSLNTHAQYKNLVMEGGGIRGIAYIGAIQAWDSAGLLNTIEKVGGSSAGAIQACLLALGYTPKQMEIILLQTSFKKFNDGGFMAIPGAIRLKQKLGWYKGDAFTKWIEALIEQKTGDANFTFNQLNTQKMQFGGKDLYITGTDLTWGIARLFSHENYPNMRIADAVRISASIPLYFKPVWIDSTGKTFEQDNNNTNLMMVVDGGLLHNFPIEMFDSARYTTTHQNTINTQTIGFQLEDPPQMKSKYTHLHTNADLIKTIYKLLVDKPSNTPERTIIISTLDISPRIRKLPQNEVQSLLHSGRQSVIAFLSN